MILLISDEPLAPRQRLADPAAPPPAGEAWLAGPDHRVVARARVVPAGKGWIEPRGIEPVEPFRLEHDAETVFAHAPGGPVREAAARPGQRRFRAELLRAWGGRCAVTGCDIPELLDAAHLRPWRLGGAGAPLRADLHRAIDRGLAEIRDGRFRLVRPAPPYMRAAYGQYDGARLARPKPRRRPRGPARGGA